MTSMTLHRSSVFVILYDKSLRVKAVSWHVLHSGAGHFLKAELRSIFQAEVRRGEALEQRLQQP